MARRSKSRPPGTRSSRSKGTAQRKQQRAKSNASKRRSQSEIQNARRIARAQREAAFPDRSAEWVRSPKRAKRGEVPNAAAPPDRGNRARGSNPLAGRAQRSFVERQNKPQKSVADFKRLNKRRRVTRNQRWLRIVKCTQRPDPKEAGKASAKAKKTGVGSKFPNTIENFTKWCK